MPGTVDRDIVHVRTAAVKVYDIITCPSVGSTADLPVSNVELAERGPAVAQLPLGVPADCAVHELVELLVVTEPHDAGVGVGIRHHEMVEGVMRRVVL